MASTIDTLNIHWQCKHTWKRASYNTSWCLLGCSIGDLEAIVPLATQIRDWAEKMPDYFPAGSDGKPSEASPQIWLDFSGFERAANANYKAANQLVIAAKAGDSQAAINAFKTTAATCKSCHKSYRLD